MEPAQEQEQQAPIQCIICLENVLLNEPVEQCDTCSQIYHRNHIIPWLSIRRKEGNETNCPHCLADMTWLMDRLPPIPQCSYCDQYIGPRSGRLTCPFCNRTFHLNEILELRESTILLNNQEQPLTCWVCHEDISEVLNLSQVLPPSGNLVIQSAEQNNGININNLNDEAQLDSESEFENEAQPD